jgi:uncharacterized membrane protein
MANPLPAPALIPAAPDAGASRSRVDSIDLLRGLVMVVMALDHTRDFFSNVRFSPTDLGQTYAALFFTRWITHFCAPVFSLLAGTGIYLASRRSAPRDVARFLWRRGLWLIVLEWTVVWFGWTFIPVPNPVMLVLWALGSSMIAMSVLVRLPVRVVGAIAVLMIAGHNLLDGVPAASLGPLRLLWMVLHEPGFYPLHGRFGVFVLYPVVPWIGVMAAGYALGEVFTLAAVRRRRLLFAMGATACLLFVVLRVSNAYGNPPAHPGATSAGPFAVQPTVEKTAIQLLNVEKYPPSLQYLLMTLGPALLALGWFDGLTFASRRWARILLVFGRVPMFYYVAHLYLIHVLAVVVGWATGMPVRWLFQGGFAAGAVPPEYGFGLPVVYVVWATVVALLYLPCRRFASLKERSRAAWLGYL